MNKLLLAFTALALVATVSPAKADDGVTISGFVDTAYYTNNNSEESTFSLDQAEIDIKKTVEGVGSLRIDLQAVRGAANTTDDLLEQGFVTANLGPVALTFGKFNAPIGFELLDPNEMYQYSHAMVFDYGLPTNLTGAMLSGAFGMFDAAVYVVNGWDLMADDNKDKTIGGRLGITPVEGANVGLSYITGKEGSDAEGGVPANLSVMDVDFKVTMIEKLTVGGEYNAGTAEGASAVSAGKDATWTGFLVMANYAITDSIGITGRYDSFHDKDGARLGSGVDETRNAITVSPSYLFGEGMGVLAEYKMTTSDFKDAFTKKDGSTTDSQTEIAVEFTYSY
ncbi:MAG: porin [Nitrospinae bacterium]|nr:porin [Nitrospinota bacterium]